MQRNDSGVTLRKTIDELCVKAPQFVIPMKIGIPQARIPAPHPWIPAFAGMTVGMPSHFHLRMWPARPWGIIMKIGFSSSYVARRGMVNYHENSRRQVPPPPSFRRRPESRGGGVGDSATTPYVAGTLDSCFRRNDGGGVGDSATTPYIAELWIPASAGMTVLGGCLFS